MAEETEKKPVRRGRKPAAAKAQANQVPVSEAEQHAVPEAPVQASQESEAQKDSSPAREPEAQPIRQAQAQPQVQSQQPQTQPQAQNQQLQNQQQQNANAQQQRQQDNFSKKQRWLQQQGRFRGRNGNHPYGNMPPQMQQVPRDPNLPEYKLVDIHSWDNATIVERMCPDANAEDLGAMKRHDIIFNAIRSYLARGGAVMASGCLEIVREGYGYLRSAKTNFLSCPEDVFVPQQQIRRHMLRPGDMVEGPLRDPRDRDRYFGLGGVMKVNGKTPSEAARIVHFENLLPTFPTRRIVLETNPSEYSTRVMDIFTPVGFGQRGLIVAPPRVGKTVLLQKIANAITANHPEAMLIVLLIDERPEEVTDMQRNTKAMVLSSTFDEEPQHHVNVAEMTGEMARRQVENGRDVIILLDSITRLARAYNTVQPHSGKILTGGVDALSLHRPKRFFGAARNIEGGGSLTILATALIDTGSRMDEVIFEEFKGTGNMELVLDRSLADKRIFPAIDIEKSGTRKEDLLLDPMEMEKTWALRRVLADAGPERAMQSVLNGMKKIKTNPAFLLSLDLKNL
jgi:transcription termination factor Rho